MEPMSLVSVVSLLMSTCLNSHTPETYPYFVRNVGIWRGAATALVRVPGRYSEEPCSTETRSLVPPSRAKQGGTMGVDKQSVQEPWISGPFRSIPSPLACFTNGPTTSHPLQIMSSNVQFSSFQKLQSTTAPWLNKDVWTSVNMCCHPVDFPIFR